MMCRQSKKLCAQGMGMGLTVNASSKIFQNEFHIINQAGFVILPTLKDGSTQVKSHTLSLSLSIRNYFFFFLCLRRGLRLGMIIDWITESIYFLQWVQAFYINNYIQKKGQRPCVLPSLIPLLTVKLTVWFLHPSR